MKWCTLVLVCLWHVAAGWELVLKVPRGWDLHVGGYDSVYDLWSSNTTLNEDIDDPMNIMPGDTYKSRLSLDWEHKSVSLVKIAFYKGREEVAYVVFGSPTPHTDPLLGLPYNHIGRRGLNTTDWFNCQQIVHSSWKQLSNTKPNVCDMKRLGTVAHSFSILNSTLDSQSDCDHISGWFTVLEPDSANSAVKCAWQPTGSPPHFMYVPGNSSDQLSESTTADMFAIFVDDCIDDVLCRSGTCWQDPLGECHCYNYKCTEACSDLPCLQNGVCVPSPTNLSDYTCKCADGYTGKNCELLSSSGSGLSTGAIVGLCVGIVLFFALVVGAILCCYIWRHKEDKLGRSVTERAVIAKDTLRRSFRRFSGSHYPPRKHLREERSSPTLPGKSAEQLSPDSNVVFGEVNPAYIETPPINRRYTEFPTNPANDGKSISANEIQLHEFKQPEKVSPGNPDAQKQKNYENLPFSPADYRSNEVSPSFDFEQASTMSEMSDTTTTSGYAGSGYAGSGYAGSGYAGSGYATSEQLSEAPAHLPPSEMISKDVIYHHRNRPKTRSRPRSRGMVDPPRTLAPQTMENQILYAIESSRRSISSLSSASSDALGSDRATKTDVLKVRYIPSNQNRSSGMRPKSDSLSEGGTRDSSFDNESRSVESLDQSRDSLDRSTDSLDVSHDPDPRSHDRHRSCDHASPSRSRDIWSHDLEKKSHDREHGSHDQESVSDKRLYNKNSRAPVNEHSSKSSMLRSVEKHGLSGKKMPYALHKSYDCLALSHDQEERPDGKAERQLDRRSRAKSMENLSDREMRIVFDHGIAEATV